MCQSTKTAAGANCEKGAKGSAGTGIYDIDVIQYTLWLFTKYTEKKIFFCVHLILCILHEWHIRKNYRYAKIKALFLKI